MIARTVEILALRPDGVRTRVAFFGPEDRISSACLTAFEMPVAGIFED